MRCRHLRRPRAGRTTAERGRNEWTYCRVGGAGGAANAAGGYQNAAIQNLINATGSPAAQTFGRLQLAAERPAFQSSNDALSAQQAAMGLGGSGEGRALGGNVAANETGATGRRLGSALFTGAASTATSIATMPGAQSVRVSIRHRHFYQAITTRHPWRWYATSGGGAGI